MLVRAETFVWTGEANGAWSNALNWSSGIPPVGADTTVLEFGATTNPVSTNDLPGGLLLNQLRFGPDAGGVDLEGYALIFGGTAPSIVSESTSGDVFVDTAITLGTNTLTVQSEPVDDSDLRLLGDISGSGGVTVAGGMVGFGSGNSTYTGQTRILSGATAFTAQTGMNHFGASSNIVVEEGGRMLFGVSLTLASQPIVVSNAIALGGLLESITRDYASGPLFLPGAEQLGAITLTSDTAEIRAAGGSTPCRKMP